ncbi:MAG: hypothetical protein AUG75_12255, partial [Cyanobacteria bacterium 13_1_20CM_4_61_6]
MNDVLFEELLNEDESATLDFKRDQYPFVGATDEQKSELLKDIVAFANAWRRTDAYILIGVEDVKGGRSKVIGAASHPDDATLQQFVNSKTQRPLTFLYEVFASEGVQVGIIQIPLQERPVFLKHDFGKLKKNLVYVRRGSSTGIADPDEISKMGSAMALERNEPTLELQFALPKTRTEMGTALSIESEIVELPKTDQIPSQRMASIIDFNNNPDFYREMAQYIRLTSILREVGFTLKNTGSILAARAHLQIIAERKDHVLIVDESRYPKFPQRQRTIPMFLPNMGPNRISVDNHGNQWSLSLSFGSLQPKASTWSNGVFYVGALKPCQLNLEAHIYADNLSEPIKVPLSIDIETKQRKLDMKELEGAPSGV